jgi:lipopolysaccharide export system permease protein
LEKSIYISKIYLRYFAIVLSGLVLFFIIIDYIQIARKLPPSTNVQILYLYYKTLHASSILTPLALLFGAVLTLSKLVRDNTLIALYSVGYSNKSVVSPIFFIAVFITLFTIALHTTDYAYSEAKAKSIIDRDELENSENLFFKYDITSEKGEQKSYYIFFSKLYPFQKLAEGVRMFSIRDGHLAEIVRAKHAIYDGKRWVISSARFLYNSKNLLLNEKAIEIRDFDKLFVLKGFKPKILEKIYEKSSNFNLQELFEAITLLNLKEFSTEKLLVSFYSIVSFPFFAPLLILLLFKFLPVSSRFSNLSLYIFTAILISLLTWGVLFALLKLSLTGVIAGEIGVVLPIVLLAIFTLYFL